MPDPVIELDTELADQYLAECREHLTLIAQDLAALETATPETLSALLNRVFQAVHSIKGEADLFGLRQIRKLAQQIEDVLALIRYHHIEPTVERAAVLRHAGRKLSQLVNHAEVSNSLDVEATLAELAGLQADCQRTAEQRPVGTSEERLPPAPGKLRSLLAEDDFACRLLLQTFLSRYGQCHVAVTGLEAVEAVRTAFDHGERYDLICMDIMMPEMDGRVAVTHIRAMEESHGILSTFGSKIFMTTTVDDMQEIILCFRGLCDGYLIKPIDLGQLLARMTEHRLVA